MIYWAGYLIILIGITAGLVALLVYFFRSNKPPLLVNATLMLLSTFLILMGLEFFFKVFYAEPDSIGTLARENWRERYANRADRNSLGYRDVEWNNEMVAGKTKVMVVGDSFVYGDGIEYPEDRFSNILGQKLGDDYVVFNLGKGGTNTKHHINAIVKYPYAPDILVLSYVINDIKGSVLEEQWLNQPGGAPRILPEIHWLERSSYAFNFFYWRLERLLQTQADLPDSQWEWLLSIYNHPDSWWIHQQQLEAIYKGAQSQQIPLLVVVFPSMDYTEESMVVTERILEFYQQRQVSTLDVAAVIQEIPPRERMASAVDAHPSELVHLRVAEALYQLFLEDGLVLE
jgi:hypothetical protein